MTVPVDVYLDTQDYSRLSSGDPAYGDVRNALMDLREAGIARFPFSDVLVYECMPVDLASAASGIARIDAIAALSGGAHLPSAFNIVDFELDRLLAAANRSRKEPSLSDEWFAKDEWDLGARAAGRKAWADDLRADAETIQAKAALELAERAIQALDTQLEESQALRADLVKQRDRFQAIGDHQGSEIKKLRELLDERDGELRRDREQNEIYIRNVEDRAHQEIDRARLDAWQWQHRFETLERAHQSALVTAQTECDLLRDQLRRADNEVARSKGIASALEKALAKGRTAAPSRSKASRRSCKTQPEDRSACA